MAQQATDRQPDAFEKVLARDAIREVLSNYVRGIDRADGPLLKTCYHADAIEEHGGNYTGNAHAYVDAAVPRVQTMGPMQHLLGSTYIDLQGDLAYVETYVWTFARFKKDGADFDTFTGGRLIDRFERRGGQWKIAHRRTVFDWNRDTPSNEGWCVGFFNPAAPGMRMGRKDAQDPSYERF
jgi:ketosteroid isomerase-like protein